MGVHTFLFGRMATKQRVQHWYIYELSAIDAGAVDAGGVGELWGS